MSMSLFAKNLSRSAMAPVAAGVSLLALLALAACAGSSAADAEPRAATKSSSAPLATRGNDDARAPSGLRGQVDAYLAEAGMGKGVHAVELTIDPAITSLADDAVGRTAADASVREAFMIVLDPKTGEILALSGKRHGARAAVVNGAREDVPGPGPGDWELTVRQTYEPASVTKTFTVAAALDAGAIRADQVFAAENGKWRIGGDMLMDAFPHHELSTSESLVFSSNIVAGKMALALGKERLGEAFARFGFGRIPRIELKGASAGAIEPYASLSEYKTASIGAGHGFKLSPLQVAMGFASIANDGVYTPPTLVRRVKDEAGKVVPREPAPTQRVLRAETARTVMGMLESTITREDGTGKAARLQGCRVAGKTGSGDDSEGWGYGSFVGGFPAEAPRVVILAGVVARAGSGYTGGKVAAPLFREVAEKLVVKLGCNR